MAISAIIPVTGMRSDALRTRDHGLLNRGHLLRGDFFVPLPTEEPDGGFDRVA